MRLRQQFATLLTIAGVLAAPVTFSACASGSRTYDPIDGQYYRWNRAEDRRYRRWELETRRSHLDYGRRPADEQRAYSAWRHGH